MTSLYNWCIENNKSDLLSEWHPTKNGELTTQNVTHSSNKRVCWQCVHGHEWEVKISSRTSFNTGCPCCSGHKVCADNCLAFLRPELLKEWDFKKNEKLTPNDVTGGSDRKVWWRCGKEHSYEAKIYEKTKGIGCPICSGKQILIGYNDLATINPNLAKEWHPTKNGELTPQNVTVSSNRIVSWKCVQGHEWEVKVSSRTSFNTGCPYCSGRRASADNCLAFLKPELLKEWDFEKNERLTPSDVTLGSHQKAWWKCEKGHSYVAKIYEKTKGHGCSICSSNQILLGYNDLQTINPNLAKEWHPTKNGGLQPTSVFPSTNRKVWWQCGSGHEWEASINNRNSRNGCPTCSTEQGTSFAEQAIYFYLIKKFNDTVNRFMLNNKTEVDIYLPGFMIGIEYDGKYFHKSPLSVLREERKYKSLKMEGITLIRVKEDTTNISTHKTADFIIECNYISRNYKELDNMLINLLLILSKQTALTMDIEIDTQRDRWLIWEKYLSDKKERSLESCYPDIAKEWHQTKNGRVKPITVIPGSEKKVWWQCENGHEWEANINSRVSGGSGCPYCYGRVAIVGESDLATTQPNLALEWHPTKNMSLNPEDVKAGTNQKVWWNCNKGHEWQATISNRTAGTNCPICTNKQVLTGYNDLATIHPNLAREWHPLKNEEIRPTDVVSGAGLNIWWKCDKGHEYRALLSNRTSGDGCPYCSGHKVSQENCLATLRPDLTVEWHLSKNANLTPRDVTCGSNLSVWWMCKKGHEWDATIINRDKGNGCPICAGKKVLVGYNDLATINPGLAKEWNYTKNDLLLPQNVTPGSPKKVWWVCDKQHEWEAIVNGRTNKETGCPYCSGLYAITGETDLVTTNPNIAKEWHLHKNGDLKPIDVKAGSGKMVWWRCNHCGHEYQKIVRQKVKASVCPVCKD